MGNAVRGRSNSILAAFILNHLASRRTKEVASRSAIRRAASASNKSLCACSTLHAGRRARSIVSRATSGQGMRRLSMRAWLALLLATACLHSFEARPLEAPGKCPPDCEQISRRTIERFHLFIVLQWCCTPTPSDSPEAPFCSHFHCQAPASWL